MYTSKSRKLLDALEASFRKQDMTAQRLQTPVPQADHSRVLRDVHKHYTKAAALQADNLGKFQIA